MEWLLPAGVLIPADSGTYCLQGFSLKALKHLVLDEADRLLNMDFEQEIDQILKVHPSLTQSRERPDMDILVFSVPDGRVLKVCSLLPAGLLSMPLCAAHPPAAHAATLWAR